MEGLFNNRYRISSARLQSWNYASEGMYFVTICTKDRSCYFGEIVPTVETRCIASPSGTESNNLDTQCVAYLHASEIGEIAKAEWYKTAALRQDMHVELGEFVVMPNHVHGIIIIGANEFNGGRDAMHRVSGIDVDFNFDKMEDATHRVSTGNTVGPQSKNLASIMRGYKSAVTTYARKNNIDFGWQSRFHDHIIRSMDEYVRISDYIRNNPLKWQV